MDTRNGPRALVGGRVVTRRLGAAVSAMVAVALLTFGCFEKLAGPGCVAATWDVVCTSGDTITTTRGLRYIAGDSGIGNGAPWCRSVAVNYTGYLLDGTKFDSSIDVGRALIFTPGVGSLVDGFEQGVIGMRSCATRRLIIPPNLGFGANPVRNDAGDIIVPANSTVVFDIQMLEIGNEPVVPCDSTGP